MLDLGKSEGQMVAQKDLTGDSGDPFPGVNNVTDFDDTSSPNSRSFDNKDSCVVINCISNSDLIMTANMGVTCPQRNMQKTNSKEVNSPKIITPQITSPQITNPVMITPEMKPIADYPPIDDCTKMIKEKTCINHYQNGYKKGYNQGYLDAIKKLRK